jgi:WD40 repeat protein
LRPDSSVLAYGSGADIRVWDIAHNTEQTVITGHSELVQGLAFSPDGRLLVAVKYNVDTGGYSFHFWDANPFDHLTAVDVQVELYLSTQPSVFAFSPDNVLLAYTSPHTDKVSILDISELHSTGIVYEVSPQQGSTDSRTHNTFFTN